MKKHLTLGRVLLIAVLFALLLTAINLEVVFAEGEVPEIPPEKIQPTETGLEGNKVQDVVVLLAETQATIIDQNKSTIPLTSRAALDALNDPDPWFYCSVGCSGGRSPLYTTINQALAEWAARKGTGMIYLEGGFNQTEDVILDGTTFGLRTLRGIIWNTALPGVKPQLTGKISITKFLSGFKLEGISIYANSKFGIFMMSNSGSIALNNLDISNASDGGIQITDQKGSISLNQVSISNCTSVAILDNTYWNGSAYVSLGGISITNSKFMQNGSAAPNDHGLVILSKGAIFLNGVTSFGNQGTGLSIVSSGISVTIKNSVFSSNFADQNDIEQGYGIYIEPIITANITLDNVYITNNEIIGAVITTLGNVIIKKVVVTGNGDEGIRITDNDDTYGNGARNVIISDSVFSSNGSTNLVIRASGMVKITNLISTKSIHGSGLDASNDGKSIPLILSNAILTENSALGAFLNSKGTITLNGINASYNGSNGLYLANYDPGATGNIIMLGTLGLNLVNNNGLGVFIQSSHNIFLSLIQATDNLGSGIFIIGNGLSSNVNLTSVESSNNLGKGIDILTTGSVTINKTIASKNSDTGLVIANTTATTAKNVLVSNSTFNNNAALSSSGLYITSVGLISLNNVNANENSQFGAYLDNSNITLSTQIPQGVSVNKSTFNNSIDSNGLTINSLRKITLSNINASGNGLNGIEANNSGSTVFSSIVVTGVNHLLDNFKEGISLYSGGTVIVSGVTAIRNESNYIISNNSVILTNSQFSNNRWSGVSITSHGNMIISGVTAIGNGIQLNERGIFAWLFSGRLYIYNSIIMANNGYGLHADVINPITDVYLAPTTVIFGNDTGMPYGDSDIRIE
jgi:hypothetical protein